MASNGIINPNQIHHEIETLKSQKQEIEARISLLQSQLLQQQHSSCPPISAVQGTQEKDNKQGEQATHVVLKVLGEEGDRVLIRMKRSSQFKKLMDLYCDRQSVDFWSIAFFFNTRQLIPNLTPDELNLKDGDVIDAFFKMPHSRRN